MTAKKTILILFSMGLSLAGCTLFSNVPGNLSETATHLPTFFPTQTPLVLTATVPASTATLTPTTTLTVTETPSATPTPTPAITPTYAILRGQVNVERVSCRYGPGPDYLFLYGMVQGANQDVIGRTDTGAWVLTRARGDNKSCWVKTGFLDLNGDVMSVEMVYPDKYVVPPSNQGYLPPWDVAAVRTGDKVVITWKSEARRPGDEESATSVLYMVETWVCHGGRVIFTPIGAHVPQVFVTDEAGCSEPSHGRVYFVEKHGYTGPSEIPWPPAVPPTP